MNIIDSLNWRYATKKFDATKKVSEQDYEELKEALRLTPSSYGLQPYRILEIEDENTREKLKEASWGQAQVADASHFIVFCADTNFSENHIEEMLERTATARKLKKEDVAGYGDFMKSTLIPKGQEWLTSWAARQCYIALGNALTVGALKKIDMTPMEGFEPEKYIEILGLENENLLPVVALAIGYRAEDDTYQQLGKVRKHAGDLFKKI